MDDQQSWYISSKELRMSSLISWKLESDFESKLRREKDTIEKQRAWAARKDTSYIQVCGVMQTMIEYGYNDGSLI